MFLPDYICLALCACMVVSSGVVLTWPERKTP